jgi:DNA repair protein RecN (Recombination protein N)
MIDELRIRALGVIEDATIAFGPRLTVVTGETGAGKTMVLSGLSLVMGGRAEAAMVRRDADRADVDGRWVLGGTRATVLAEAIDAVGGAVDGDVGGGIDGDVGGGIDGDVGGGIDGDVSHVVVTLGRSVSSSGRSRAFAGGRSVPAATLADVTESLVTVHGQSDQLQLRDARSQRELLDRFGGPEVLQLRAEFAQSLLRLREAQRERAELVDRRQEREREAVLLRHGIAEIEAVSPEPGEDVDLKEQSIVLANATDLLVEVAAAHAALGSDDGSQASVRTLLQLAHRHVERASALDPRAAELARSLTEAMAQMDALAEEVSAYAGSLEADPESQSRVEERRHRISDLKRRYGPGLEDVLSWWKQAVETVAAVDGTEGRVEELEEQIRGLRDDVRRRADRLSELRREAATRLATAVTAELRELAMPDAHVVIEVVSTEDESAYSPAGADQVALLLTPHAGSDPRPLGSGASGGELSRVMLAIEVVLAGIDDTPTFVFDEVDAGIGGRVAVEVGRRLARLARTAQVIVVTHLPQVAAFADVHIVVTKDSSGQVTGSSVVEVTGEARVAELVRMLSGLEGSASGAEHATELLQLAASERAAT